MGSPTAVFWATIISGISELAQRSSLVAIDEFLRVHIFRAPISQAMRARQIKIWTDDICGAQLVELATIPVLGFAGYAPVVTRVRSQQTTPARSVLPSTPLLTPPCLRT